MIVSGPRPTAGSDAGRLEVLLVVVKGAEVRVDLFEDPVGGFAVASKNGEIEFVVFQSAESEGEVDLECADGGIDLVGHRRIGGIGHTHFFDFG